MKKMFLVVAAATVMCINGAKAQEFSVGADVVSSYVWRGQHLGGLSIQPSLGFSVAGLSIGAWGSTDIINGFTTLPGYSKELDLSIGYEIAGLTVGITDYFITPGGVSYFNYSADEGTAHTFELNLGYTLPIEKLPLSLSWNTNFAGAVGLNNEGEDAYASYFEVSYPFAVKDVSLTAALGLTPWANTSYGNIGDSGFNVINLALTASKELKLGSFSIPVFGQLVINPRAEDIFLVFGASF
ncbi:MAG: hypothetical protein LBR66_08650 [Candidatus Symbiothrix sp.]|jgi:hypothetical protein|nr:hypothetical protein [Candidatus Symbiothrix sp.]